jgi:hypothetical protein
VVALSVGILPTYFGSEVEEEVVEAPAAAAAWW